MVGDALRPDSFAIRTESGALKGKIQPAGPGEALNFTLERFSRAAVLQTFRRVCGGMTPCGHGRCSVSN
jgi:hypothetical protein